MASTKHCFVLWAERGKTSFQQEVERQWGKHTWCFSTLCWAALTYTILSSVSPGALENVHVPNLLISAMLCYVICAGKQLLQSADCWSRFGAALLGRALSERTVPPEYANVSLLQQAWDWKPLAGNTWGRCWPPSGLGSVPWEQMR